MEPVRIYYFSDVLCIWAYIAQRRLDELQTTFSEQIIIDNHFLPVFGDAHRKLENRWRDRGGFSGYSGHVRQVAARFEHITVHPEIWTKDIPYSSTSSHLFLRAIKLLEDKEIVDSVFEKAIWAFREAFFLHLANIAQRSVQFEIAEQLGLPVAQIQAQIDSGAAYADLSRDLDLMKEQTVTVSPTLIFNEGRQRLNGNVGYRVMEANIRELLLNPPEEQSWC